VQARDHIYYRRDEPSASAASDDTASETPLDHKSTTSDSASESKPAAKVDAAESNAESKTKEIPETETAEKDVSSDKSTDETAKKTVNSKASEKSKARKPNKAAKARPAPKSDATEGSAESKDAAPKTHSHHTLEAHKTGRKGHHGAPGHAKDSKARIPAYKPRPKGQRTKPKSKKPYVSDHHSSRFNPHHKMIPQIARRHELRARNAAAEADAWADAHAKYLRERDVYAQYVAKREAHAYPEAWACSDPSGCN